MNRLTSLPCVDCICVPVCLTRYKKYYYIGDATFPRTSRVELQKKCTLLSDYIYCCRYSVDDRIMNTHAFFGGDGTKDIEDVTMY